MKLIIATCLSLTVTVFSFIGTPVAEASSHDQEVPDNNKYLSSLIDEIDVPYDVLIYAQITYQGYAVTTAREIHRGGDQLYQLRVDRDNIPNDYDSIHLIYDKDWNLLEDKEILQPPKPKKVENEEAAPEKEDKEKPDTKPQQQENDSSGNDDDKDEPANPRKEEDNDANDETTETNTGTG